MDATLFIQICFVIAFAAACIIMLFALIGVLITRWVCTRNYKKSVIDIVKRGLQKDDEDVLSNLLMQYEACSSNTFGVVIASMDAINAKVLAELNASTYKRYHDELESDKDLVIEKLEKVIKLFKDKTMFSYEKMNELVSEIAECSDIEKMQALSEKAKSLYETCLFYCNGRIFEKEARILDLQYEVKSLKKKKIGTIIIGVIGLVSGILTIITTIATII